MTALLEQPPVVRMYPLKTFQRRERIRYAAEVPLADGDQVQDVPVLWNLGEQCLRGRQRLGELALLEELARAPNFGFDAQGGAIGWRIEAEVRRTRQLLEKGQ